MTSAHYGLGYAPDGWQSLAQVFQPYPNTALVDTGMVIDNEGKPLRPLSPSDYVPYP